MKLNNVEKVIELSHELESLKTEYKHWKIATGFGSEIKIHRDKQNHRNWVNVESKYVDFERVKLTTLERIALRLAEVREAIMNLD